MQNTSLKESREETTGLRADDGCPDHRNRQMAGALSRQFRKGMRPLALTTAFCVALSAPLADFLLERHDIARRATEQARRLTRALRNAPTQQLSLSKLEPELSTVNLDGGSADDVAVVELRSSEGTVLETLRPRGFIRSWPLVRGSSTEFIDGRPYEVAVTLGEREWLRRDLLLLCAFSLLGGVLGLALYFFPLRLFREEDIVRLLAWRSIKTAEEERLRLSRDLHDGVGQSIGAAAVAVARLSARVGPSREAAESARLLDGALDELRQVVRGLRPTALDDLGLGAAVQALVRDAAGTGLNIQTDIEDLPRIAPEVEQTCFRLAQEALANVVRHSRAHSVRVGLALRSRDIVLEVEDDGCGFTPATDVGLGLVGARERAALLAGSLTIESAHGAGTLIRAVLPIEALA
jgi:signal transduction histidine kinase